MSRSPLTVPRSPFTVPRFPAYILPVPLDRPPAILAVRFSSIGDVILTTPLLRALRARHPGARITMVTKRAMLPLLAANPYLDEVVALEPGEGIGAIARRLRASRYTHGLDLHGSLRSLALRRLIPARWQGYDKRLVARWALIHLHRNWYRDQVPTAERYFEAARDLDVRPDGGPPQVIVPPAVVSKMGAWLGAKGIPPRFAVLAPGAAHFTKRWPVESWTALARSLAERGLGVVTVGGKDDAGAGRSVAGAAGPSGASATGETDLLETAALLAQAAVVVSGDTGVMHLATAVGAPVVALFGPTVREFGFFPYSPLATVVERELSCRPCSSHGSARCPLGHHDCLRRMEVATVERAVMERAR